MKIFRVKKRLMIVGAASAVALALGGSAGASADSVPFGATFSGTVTATPCAPLTICLAGTSEGVATHLGRATMTTHAVVHITFATCPGGIITTFSETATLTAANGDTLELAGSGTACAGGGQSTATAILTVTEGAGRFAGVTGSLSEQIFHDLASGFDRVVLSGRISAPGA
jgi:hypothetical protein